MNGYTRQDIIKKLEANRTIGNKFQTEEQFIGWCNRNLTYIKQDKKIKPINTEGMKHINEDWKDKEYYSSQDTNIMYQELLRLYDELDIKIEMLVNTNQIKDALSNLNITLVNPSARISTVAKNLKIKVAKPGRPGYYTMADANSIIAEIRETYRGNTEETDEDKAIEEIKKVYKKCDDLEIKNARQKTEIERLELLVKTLTQEKLEQQGIIARLEKENSNKHTSNKLINMILGRNRGEVV